MNVILVGYRGTGKSVVANQLAKHLDLAVAGLDAEIELASGMTIPEIVEQLGWNGFRDIEQKMVSQFAARDQLVIDCGGGVIEREDNIAALHSAGTVVWLKASPETIIRRIASDDQRPSLTGTQSFTDEVAEVLERRTPLYRRVAHLEVDTDQLSVEQVVADILRQLDRPRGTRAS